MELKNYLLFKIDDFNCEFRTLSEIDVSNNYINGLREQTEYIKNIPADLTISKQKKYIKKILLSEGDTICGLFFNRELVGTAGVQSSNSLLKYIEVPAESAATVGIFLFKKSFRGRGLGKTLVWAATSLFNHSTKVEWFGANMKKRNIPSLKSFLSCGYNNIYENKNEYKVLINYSELIKPDNIKNIVIM
jgi:RimJ/RimL family protein N-acetyltransferase